MAKQTKEFYFRNHVRKMIKSITFNPLKFTHVHCVFYLELNPCEGSCSYCDNITFRISIT